jgi:hypothetical protein
MAESTFTYQKVYSGLTASGLSTMCTATRVAWYQDPQSISARANLVAKYRLGGIAQWTLGMEDPLAMSNVRDFAKSISPDQVVATLNSDVDSIPLGGPVSLTGAFKLPDSTPIAGLPVAVEVSNPATGWHQIFSGPTGIDGTISTKMLLGQTSMIRMKSEGNWDRLPSISGEKSVAITRLISFASPSSIKHGIVYQITGEVQPRAGGVTVLLDDSSNSGISAKMLTTTTDANGKFSIPILGKLGLGKRTGIMRARLIIKKDGNFNETHSNYLNILIR